jgi:hypothetical protein
VERKKSTRSVGGGTNFRGCPWCVEECGQGEVHLSLIGEGGSKRRATPPPGLHQSSGLGIEADSRRGGKGSKVCPQVR